MEISSKPLDSFYMPKFWSWTKRPILIETKPPVSETGQNCRFRKLDKTADFKVELNRRFCIREQTVIKIVSLIKASWHNYR